MLVLNDGFVIIIIDIIYVYIKSEFSEIIKIDIFLYMLFGRLFGVFGFEV